MNSWWNGVGTGIITIGLGAFAFLLAYVPSRRTGQPFIAHRTIGGYNGVVGIVIMGVGVVILAVSLIGLVWLQIAAD